MPVVTVLLAIVIAPAGVGLTFRVTLESVSMERPKLARTTSVLIVVGLAAEAWKDSVTVPIARADRKTMVARARLAKRFLLYPPPEDNLCVVFHKRIIVVYIIAQAKIKMQIFSRKFSWLQTIQSIRLAVE